jgi:DnaJ-class molecular chaperone
MARTAKIVTGYGVDSVPFTASVIVPDGQEVCKQCRGLGEWHYTAAHDGFERHESCTCENCDGEGFVYSSEEEDNG